MFQGSNFYRGIEKTYSQRFPKDLMQGVENTQDACRRVLALHHE